MRKNTKEPLRLPSRSIFLPLERFHRVADTNYAYRYRTVRVRASSSELCSFVSQNSDEYPQLEAQEGAVNQMAAPMDNRHFSFSEAWWLLTNVQLQCTSIYDTSRHGENLVQTNNPQQKHEQKYTRCLLTCMTTDSRFERLF